MKTGLRTTIAFLGVVAVLLPTASDTRSASTSLKTVTSAHEMPVEETGPLGKLVGGMKSWVGHLQSDDCPHAGMDRFRQPCGRWPSPDELRQYWTLVD